MELIEKIIEALREPLGAEYIRLNDDDGISGFVVSPKFEEMSSMDRQQLIDETLRKAADLLTDKEQRQILMIACLTPLEYESVSSRIRVHGIKVMDDGSLEVLLHGHYSDAVYVRGALNNQKDVTTTEPEQCPGADFFMKFLAKGTDTNPLTKEIAISVLMADQYIEVMQVA